MSFNHVSKVIISRRLFIFEDCGALMQYVHSYTVGMNQNKFDSDPAEAPKVSRGWVLDKRCFFFVPASNKEFEKKVHPPVDHNKPLPPIPLGPQKDDLQVGTKTSDATEQTVQLSHNTGRVGNKAPRAPARNGHSYGQHLQHTGVYPSWI